MTIRRRFSWRGANRCAGSYSGTPHSLTALAQNGRKRRDFCCCWYFCACPCLISCKFEPLAGRSNLTALALGSAHAPPLVITRVLCAHYPPGGKFATCCHRTSWTPKPPSGSRRVRALRRRRDGVRSAQMFRRRKCRREEPNCLCALGGSGASLSLAFVLASRSRQHAGIGVTENPRCGHFSAPTRPINPEGSAGTGSSSCGKRARQGSFRDASLGKHVELGAAVK